MSNKRIIYTQTNGIAAVVIPAGEIQYAIATLPRKVVVGKVISLGVSEPVEIKKGDLIDPRLASMNKVITDYIEYEIVEVQDVPADRSYRDVWHHDTTETPQKIGVKLEDARDVSLARVRAARDEALEALDKEYTIALRTGESTEALDEKRTLLLDATEELKLLDVNQDGYLSVEEVAGQVLTKEAEALLNTTK